MFNKEEVHDLIKKETEKAVKTAIYATAEAERRKIRKERRKKFFKRLWTLIKIVALVGLGYCIAIHKDLIIAWIKGEELPELPAGHFKCPLMK